MFEKILIALVSGILGFILPFSVNAWKGIRNNKDIETLFIKKLIMLIIKFDKNLIGYREMLHNI